MSSVALSRCPEPVDLDCANRLMAKLDPGERVAWVLERLPGNHVLSSSFGVQSALMLHLVTRAAPGIPVVFIDTGYHFPETYRFVDELTGSLKLNLQVYRAPVSAAWQEARHGRRWERGLTAIDNYNRENKIEPMRRALDELQAGTWLAGLRRSQTRTRSGLNFLTRQWRRFKVYPVADWTDRDVHAYLTRHKLPYHPLREQGYLSIGDWHTTRTLKEVHNVDELRFFGLARECGLHQV